MVTTSPPALELEARDREGAVAAGEDDALDRALERLLAGFALAVAGGAGARAVERIHADQWSMKAGLQQRRHGWLWSGRIAESGTAPESAPTPSSPRRTQER